MSDQRLNMWIVILGFQAMDCSVGMKHSNTLDCQPMKTLLVIKCVL